MGKNILLLVMMAAAPGFAQDVNVLSLKGAVTAGVKGELKPLKLGSRVADGQTVKTGPGALVILRYPDESRIKLKENTELVVRAPAIIKEPRGVDLVVGAVFALVRKGQDGKFLVKTPVAVAGVRGTQFFTSYDKNVWMCVEEGEVEMTELNHPAPVVVSAGMGIVVEKGKVIAPPKKYAWTKKLNWNMDPDKGDVTDKTVIEEYDPLKKNYD